MDIENKDNERKLPSLGQQLKDAREHLGLSIDEIGRKLCLRNAVILAIEADEQPANISDVFWRGYIRTYAKCVKIKEDEINTLMEELSAPVASSSTEKLMQFSQKKKRKQHDNWLKIFTILIIIVVIGLSVMWWWQKDGQSTKAAPVETVDSISVISTKPTVSFNEQSSTVPNQSGLKEASGKPVEPTVAPSVANAHIPNESEKPIVVSSPSAQQDENQIKQQEDILQSAQLVDSRAPSQEISTGVSGSEVNQTIRNNKLVISFTNDCWVRVLDEKNNKVLYSGLKKSGDMLNFNLDVDYEVKLGVPAAASVVFNENSVDLSDYIKGKRVATLKLKAQE